MKKVVSLMISADWHIGAIDPYRFKKELITLVKETLHEKKSLDLFIVAGDTFDMKEYLSSDSVKVFFLIMAELLELTKEYNTEFRFIEGTRTHDALQLSTLKVVFENLLMNKRVKFIEEVTKEEIHGLDILYIPEEYIEDNEIYYKDYFNNHYDFIFGHGNTDLMWYMKDVKKTKGFSSPVFKSSELLQIANYIYFGHFHYRMESKESDRFKSIGPVSRWEFGKEGDCGFYYTIYDNDSKLGIEDYIENIYAPILTTTILNIKKSYELDELDREIKRKINGVKDNADKIRLIVNIDTSIENYITMRDFILSAFRNIDNLTLIIKLIGEEESESPENQLEDNNLSIEEKPYLYDKSMHDEARIAAFIRKKEGVNISLESILDVITKKDTKINAREE